MKIGDEVFVHGYVDEIRKDCIIIRNDGGYFGTVPSEVFCYEEDRNGDGTMNEADTPQTERSACDTCQWHNSGIPCGVEPSVCKREVADTPQTDCETCRHYKLACELFSEVCKYEPITQTGTQNSNLTFEKQTDCGWK